MKRESQSCGTDKIKAVSLSPARCEASIMSVVFL